MQLQDWGPMKVIIDYSQLETDLAARYGSITSGKGEIVMDNIEGAFSKIIGFFSEWIQVRRPISQLGLEGTYLQRVEYTSVTLRD